MQALLQQKQYLVADGANRTKIRRFGTSATL
jgi:hypothetical protein